VFAVASGGKRDEEDESDAACALREAEEEVGLSRTLLVPFDEAVAVAAAASSTAEDATTTTTEWPTGIHLLTTGQPALSKDNLLVRPVIAAIPAPSFLLPATAAAAAFTSTASPSSSSPRPPLWLGTFDPVCSTAEVACLFSLPLRCFHDARLPAHSFSHAASDITWRGQHMRLHEFRATLAHGEYIISDTEARRLNGNDASSASSASALAAVPAAAVSASGASPTAASSSNGDGGSPLPPREFRVWGLTAYMLIRAAEIIYGQKPVFEIGATLTKKPTPEQTLDAAATASQASKL
jgi:hypothetical protein